MKVGGRAALPAGVFDAARNLPVHVIRDQPHVAPRFREQRDHERRGRALFGEPGGAYSADTIAHRCLSISERVGFRVIAYGLGRHSFATAALTNGVPDVLVAGLLGHTGTTMLHRHYAHVGENARAMRDAAERARGKAG